MIYNHLEKYSKWLAIVIISILILGGAYQNFKHADDLITQKKDTYAQIKMAGLWLKENSHPDAKILTVSIVQNQYYSERQSYGLFERTAQLPKDCVDKFGATIVNASCQYASEDLFEEKLEALQPDYLVVSVFEPVFTPQWMYTYPQRNNLTAVQAYADNENRPMLIIFKLK